MQNKKYNLRDVQTFWNKESCGERYLDINDSSPDYKSEQIKRYELEPYILTFADFESMQGLDVLEIGVGMGCDHSIIASYNPKSLTGVDLTERAIKHSIKRLHQLGQVSNLRVDNAEDLSFLSEQFDIVYSWGALHHSENPEKCFKEVWRVLRKSGLAKIMIYNKYSLTGFYLWIRYALMTGRFKTTMSEIYSEHLESPGTKAYTPKEVRCLLKDFSKVDITVQLSFGDLLYGEAGARHSGFLLRLARILIPRFFIIQFAKVFPLGLYLLIVARK